MPYIMIGGGSGQCILEVSHVPNVGDTIHVSESMIVWAKSDNAYLMVGKPCQIADSARYVDTGRENYGKLPWFSVQTMSKFTQ